MTLLEELMEKRAAMEDNLASVFSPLKIQSEGKPKVRNSQLRGNSGQDHVMRKGKQLENVRRTEHVAKGKSEASVRRLLGLFGTERDLANLQDLVYENLPGENSEEAFGPQVVLDEYDNIVGTNNRLLIGATTLTVEQVVEAIHRWAGLAIASHIDRERFSLVGQLGFIPEGLNLDAVEVSRSASAAQNYGYPVIRSSDAHFLEDIGSNSTCFMMEDASIQEIKKALRGELGRAIASN